MLPNAWKKTTYFHPVMRQFGSGPACMLVVDSNDRRGNERVWVGIADTIGADAAALWGAHNGWHAVGDGRHRRPRRQPARRGQPAWIRGRSTRPGGLGQRLGHVPDQGVGIAHHLRRQPGSRKANRTGGAGQQLVIAKSSRQGPTPEMLNAYYTMMLFLTGDLNSGILGPYTNRSQNDAGLLMDWLDLGQLRRHRTAASGRSATASPSRTSSAPSSSPPI